MGILILLAYSLSLICFIVIVLIELKRLFFIKRSGDRSEGNCDVAVEGSGNTKAASRTRAHRLKNISGIRITKTTALQNEESLKERLQI